MKTKLLLVIMLCLVAPAVYAGGVTVKKQEAYQQPAGWIDRVSKRSRFGKVFEKDSIGSGRFMAVIGIEPMHYDSAGTWRELKAVSAPDTAAGYNLSVKTGRWSVDIDTTTGAFRFLRDTGSKKGSIRFTPAFSPANVPIEYDLSGSGIKATYTLNSGNRLAWGYTRTSSLDTTGSLGKGKGRLKNALAQIKAELREFNAVDAKQRTVPLTATWTSDSLLVVLDTTGMEFPIQVDPSIIDSLRRSSSLAGTGFLTPLARSRLNAQNVTTPITTAGVGHFYGGGYNQTWRSFISFPLPLTAVGIDSVKLRFTFTSTKGTTAPRKLVLAKGTFSGTPDSTWWNDFVGWKGGDTVYTPARLATDVTIADGAKEVLLNSYAVSLLDSLKNNDTLRVALLDTNDVRALYWPVDNYSYTNVTNPVLEIFYGSYNLPGVSTVIDSLKPAVQLRAKIDSTGGLNATTITFKLWPKGATLAGDTVVRTRSGSFGAGEVTLYEDSLPPDTLMRWMFGATNAVGTTWSAPDSFRTEITGGGTGGGALTVDGRRVNKNVR